jgi:hypothetical protein
MTLIYTIYGIRMKATSVPWTFDKPLKTLAEYSTMASFPACRNIIMILSNTLDIFTPTTSIPPFPKHLALHILAIARNKYMARDVVKLRQMAQAAVGSFTQIGLMDNGDAELLCQVDRLCEKIRSCYVSTSCSFHHNNR